VRERRKTIQKWTRTNTAFIQKRTPSSAALPLRHTAAPDIRTKRVNTQRSRTLYSTNSVSATKQGNRKKYRRDEQAHRQGIVSFSRVPFMFILKKAEDSIQKNELYRQWKRLLRETLMAEWRLQLCVELIFALSWC